MASSRLDEIRSLRLDKLANLKKLGVNPYPSKFTPPPDHPHLPVSAARLNHGQIVSVAGRLWKLRSHGQLTFADLKDASGQIQLLFQSSELSDKYELLKLLDAGDFLGVTGRIITTQAGEITVSVASFQLLTKALRPLPDDWYGLKDIEDRYRKRYLDLLINPEVKKRFVTRSRLVKEIRLYLDRLGYQEVETPTLQSLYGGANAKPFKTHVNSLNTDIYLRIADELYLKRLLVSDMEKVFEICKDFRNEGFDQTHHPEFTMIEYYECYADYHRIMDVTEGLFKHLATAVLGSAPLQVGNHQVDISHPWPRVTMTDAIMDQLGLDVAKSSASQLAEFAQSHKIPLLGGDSAGQLIFTIFEHLVTDKLIDPVWIINYPSAVSPLAKSIPGQPDWVERFEGYIGGKEICDGWSELTDPTEQRARFEFDTQAARKDQEEAQKVDEDFLEAMEYGLPPIGGIGIGIDRLTMFFTNTWSIKEVILFPLLRPDQQ